MVYRSINVPTLPLVRDDLTILAQIIQARFDYYCKHASPFERDFVAKISTIVGLGFIPALVDGEAVATYQSQLNKFIQYRNFKERQGIIPALSLGIAEMVSLGAFLFRGLNYPTYYQYFALSTRELVNSTVSGLYANFGDAEKLKVERVLDTLFPKHQK